MDNNYVSSTNALGHEVLGSKIIGEFGKNLNKKRSFHTYIDHLIEVHNLIANNKGDSQEADDIRDSMDYLWSNFTEDDHKWLDNLSGELYMLSGQDMYCIVPDAEKIILKQELINSINNQNWFHVIEILQNALDLPLPLIASYRALAWTHKSPKVANLFHTFALITSLSCNGCIRGQLESRACCHDCTRHAIHDNYYTTQMELERKS